MPKKESLNRLYEARLERGTSNPGWKGFHKGVTELNGKSPDYSGIQNVALIGTHHDQETVISMISSEMKKKYLKDLSVVEITSATLEGVHRGYIDLILNYFLPYGDYSEFPDTKSFISENR